MIPATIQIGFDPASPEGDMTVHFLVRGTGAEVMRQSVTIGKEAVENRDGDIKKVVAMALKRLAEKLDSDSTEWETLAENHGLPPHMLRVVNELADLEADIVALSKFIGAEPGSTPSKAWNMLLRYQKADLAQQLGEQVALAETLRRRLKRARAEIAQ